MEGRRHGDVEGNGVDVRRDRGREANAEFAILPTALIRREIRSSMVKQLASSPDHMKPSTPSSFSFLPLDVYPFPPLPFTPPAFISLRPRLRALRSVSVDREEDVRGTSRRGTAPFESSFPSRIARCLGETFHRARRTIARSRSVGTRVAFIQVHRD